MNVQLCGNIWKNDATMQCAHFRQNCLSQNNKQTVNLNKMISVCSLPRNGGKVHVLCFFSCHIEQEFVLNYLYVLIFSFFSPNDGSHVSFRLVTERDGVFLLLLLFFLLAPVLLPVTKG